MALLKITRTAHGGPTTTVDEGYDAIVGRVGAVEMLRHRAWVESQEMLADHEGHDITLNYRGDSAEIVHRRSSCACAPLRVLYRIESL